VYGLSGELRIERLSARALSVPLREPFVIASGRVDATRAVEVEARIRWRGVTATGLGEAACLPPVTEEDQPDVLREVSKAAELLDRPLAAEGHALEETLAEALPRFPVTRAGLETALLDAMARIEGVPLRVMLAALLADGRAATHALETDVTVAIASPARMAELAREWFARGFRALKIKVGKDVEDDIRALEAVARAVPGARLRVDANAGYTAREAITLANACEGLGFGAAIECWEQPCASGDLAGMREVAAAVRAPVIADESVKSFGDFHELVRERYAGGVNLKLAKLGSVLGAVRMGVAAKAAGLQVMVGGMVETRLGMSAAAHVACAVGGVEFVDLDTAWLLAEDPYQGGYEAEGPHYSMPNARGLGVTRRLAVPLAGDL
jgi:L-alanine-DL-glutamate epimerase-like enolase superfamily enzyme